VKENEAVPEGIWKRGGRGTKEGGTGRSKGVSGVQTAKSGIRGVGLGQKLQKITPGQEKEKRLLYFYVHPKLVSTVSSG